MNQLVRLTRNNQVSFKHSLYSISGQEKQDIFIYENEYCHQSPSQSFAAASVQDILSQADFDEKKPFRNKIAISYQSLNVLEHGLKPFIQPDFVPLALRKPDQRMETVSVLLVRVRVSHSSIQAHQRHPFRSQILVPYTTHHLRHLGILEHTQSIAQCIRVPTNVASCSALTAVVHSLLQLCMAETLESLED